jgi:hypothetical protein
MANRNLSEVELGRVNQLLCSIRARLDRLSNGDPALLWAYRRKIYKELTYDERGKPMHRRRLKELKRREQNGKCAVCKRGLPQRYTILDRLNAMLGYTPANTRLIHRQCDVKVQVRRRY